jgi:putative lipase involved disintegration of autophagic bodies
MSSNAYEGSYYFDLRKQGWNFLSRYEANNGFGADIYINESKKSIVIAFRGTDTFKDWSCGNANIFWKGQYKTSLNLVKKIKNKYKDYKFISVGHSLGGGLALHISLWRKGVEAIAFDSSPRVFKPRKNMKKNKKIIIYEDGEILENIRKIFFLLNKIGKVEYYKYDFLKGLGIKEHSMYQLARGLLKVAAISGDKDAINIMDDILGPSIR